MRVIRGQVARFVALICLALTACSDASLYGKDMENPAADRLGVTGRVCTDDPRKAGFPVRVIFLVDTAAGALQSSFDPELMRLAALRESLSLHGGNDTFSFAILSFDSRARKLAPSLEAFSRNAGELDDGVATLALPEACVSGICRDYSNGLELVRSLVEGDLAEMPKGERIRTQYAVIVMAAGPPSPFNCDFDCCDPLIEDCDYSTCHRSFECSKTVVRDNVIRLKEDVEKQGAASFSLHTLFLAARDGSKPDPDLELQQTEELLEEMAFVGTGRYERFNSADAITLDRIGLRKLSATFQAKSLIVSNMSVLPDLGVQVTDSDGDGLGDERERELGTNPLAGDSDGDGLRDRLERLVALNPLIPDDKPTPCRDLTGPPFTDSDRDLINDCEELLIGTDPSLPDTDGDGILDWLEVLLGTDYLRPDTLADLDGDGVLNGDELLAHTDPRSSDAASHLASAYRYQIVDEGVVNEPRVREPRRVTGVTVARAGEETTGGLGTLRYVPGDPPTLSWQDAQDPTPGPVVEIGAPGQYELASSSVEQKEYARYLIVNVDPLLFPPTITEELLLVEQSEKHCLQFTVRNIKLVETEGENGERGQNDVYIYFAEAPKGQLTLPSLFRAVHLPVVYLEGEGRTPDDLLVEIRDEEFTAIGY